MKQALENGLRILKKLDNMAPGGQKAAELRDGVRKKGQKRR